MAVKRHLDELESVLDSLNVTDTDSPASKKLKLSKETRGYARLRCGSMNEPYPKALHTELLDRAQKCGYPLMYVFFIGSLLCSNFFGQPFLRRLIKIGIWKHVWIPSRNVDSDSDKYKQVLLALVRLFPRDEKEKIQSMLKPHDYYLQQFLDVIRHGSETYLFNFLKELTFGGKINIAIPIPAGVASLISQFGDGTPLLKAYFYNILEFEPCDWNGYELTNFLTLMGLNQSTINVFGNGPIFMSVTRMTYFSGKEFDILLAKEKLDNSKQIKKFNKDLKIYNENSKESSKLADNACEHKYWTPPKIDDEQERWAAHWYRYLRNSIIV